MSSRKLGKIHRFLNWLFGGPFRQLPLEFGDPVSQDLREFETEAKEIQHHAEGTAPVRTDFHKQTKPTR